MNEGPDGLYEESHEKMIGSETKTLDLELALTKPNSAPMDVATIRPGQKEVSIF